MALSSVWKRKVSAYAFIIVLSIVVLALSVSVNTFQEFFFVADLFPMLLSIVTLVIMPLQIMFEVKFENAFTARPAFEVPLLGALTIVWLVVNCFSTSRYTSLPNCSVFSDGIDGEEGWCHSAQALRIIIWIEWLALLLTALMLTRAAIVEARRGNTAVWHKTLSRHRRSNQSRDFLQDASSFYRGSSLLGFDRVNGHQKGSSRDWFAPPAIRTSGMPGVERDSTAGSFFGPGVADLGAFGNGSQSTIPPQHQFQIHTPHSSRDAVTKTIDGFEIVSTGHYFQNEGIWGKEGLQSKP